MILVYNDYFSKIALFSNESIVFTATGALRRCVDSLRYRPSSSQPCFNGVTCIDDVETGMFSCGPCPIGYVGK